MKCAVNFDTVKTGIVRKAEELLNDGKSYTEVNRRFGEQFITPTSDTKTEDAVGLPSALYDIQPSDNLVNTYLRETTLTGMTLSSFRRMGWSNIPVGQMFKINDMWFRIETHQRGENSERLVRNLKTKKATWMTEENLYDAIEKNNVPLYEKNIFLPSERGPAIDEGTGTWNKFSPLEIGTFQINDDGTLADDGVKPIPYFNKTETQSTKAGKLTKDKVLNFLSAIGFTNIQNVKKLVHNGVELDDDAYVDFMHKVMQIVDGKDDVTLPEEGMHVLVELIQNADPELFRRMEKDIVNYQIYYKVLRDTKYNTSKFYLNEDGSINYDKMKKEAMAKLLAEFLIGDTENITETAEKVARVSSWWRTIIDWIKAKFGQFKNPFKEALARLEKDNTAFGVMDDVYSDEVFLAASKKNRTLEERDKVYSSTKAMFQNIRTLASKLGFSKDDDQYYQNGKRWSYSKTELEDMTLDQLKTVAQSFGTKFDSSSKEKIIKDIRKMQGKRVSDVADKYYEQIFRNKPLPKEKMEYYKQQATAGTWIHAIFEDTIKMLVDSETGLLKGVTGQRNESLIKTQKEKAMANKIQKYVTAFLNQFPEGTRFITEQVVFDPDTQILGTIDLLAIEPSEETKEGKVSIYDWKTMLIKTAEGAADYRRKGIGLQLTEYRRILKDGYGVTDFGKQRAIPISRIQKDDDSGGFTLEDIVLPNLNPAKIADRWLRPLISENETTGAKEKDKLITALTGVYEKFVTLLREDRLANRQILTEINDAIYELRVSTTIKHLNIYLQDLQGRIDEVLEAAAAETDFSVDTMDAYLADMSLLDTIFDSLGSASLLIDEKSYEKKDRDQLSEILSRMDRSIFKMREKREEFLEKVAEQHGVYNLLKPEMVIGQLSRLFRTLGNQDFATGRLTYELTNRAYNQIDIETDNELRQLEDLRYLFNEVQKRTGLSKKDIIGKLVNFEKGTLHSKIKQEFFDTRQQVFDSKDAKTILKFVKENYDMDAYKQWYKETLATEEAFWKSQTYSANKAEDNRIKKRKRKTFEENYSIIEHPVTAFGKHNTMIWNKGIKQDLWENEEYTALKQAGNEDLLKIYEYFLAKNKELVDIGAIKEWQQYTFIPNVRKGFTDIMSFDDKNLASKIKDWGFTSYKNWLKSLTVSDYELNYQGKKDEITGESVGKRYVPYLHYLSADEKSYDLFAIYGMMIKQIQKEKQLSKNDEIIRGLLAVEANKQSFESNKFASISKRGDKLQLSKERGQNLDLLKKYYKAIVEGELLQVDADSTITFGWREKWNNSFMGKAWKFDIDPKVYEPTKLSVTKTMMWMNNLNQKRILGLNISSGLSNLFGSTLAASRLYKPYFSDNDFYKAHTKMISGAFYATEDMRKRAALVDYFLPLLDNRSHFKSTQLSVNQASRILSQEWLMSPQRKTDEIVQLNIFLAYLENTGLVDGKLVNLREMAANETGYHARYNKGDNPTTLTEQKEIEKKFEERLKELKEKHLLTDKVTFKEIERNGKKETVVDIPGVDRMGTDVETMRSRIHTISKDATGNMDDFDIAPYRYNIYWRMFMTFKNWIPRQVDVRFGEFHKSQAHNAYEYGRFRMFYRAIGANWLTTAAKLVPMPYITGALTKNMGRQDYIAKAIEVYKEKKRQFQELGLYDKRDFISQEDFVDMYMQGVNNTFVEFRTLTFMILLLTFGIMKGDDDDDEETRSMKRLVRRQIDKMTDEIAFFYNPKSLVTVASQGPPIFGFVRDVANLVTNVGQQWFGVALENMGAEEVGENWQKSAHPMKYTFKILPVLKEVLTYLPTFDNELSKDWGVTVSNKISY